MQYKQPLILHLKKRKWGNGDKVLIKQTKTTTKPPFDSKPFHVINVKENQLTIKRGTTALKRDKGQVKHIKNSPEYLKPSWEKREIICTSNYEQQDIEGRVDKIMKKHYSQIPLPPTTNQPPSPSPLPATINNQSNIPTQKKCSIYK